MVKGKGKKGKKGKKGSKKSKDEGKEENMAKMAERNSNIWEAKMKMENFHKDHYKETSKQLVEENTSLINHMQQTEKDTVEVVAYLRKLDSEKDVEIADLKGQLKVIHSAHQTQTDTLLAEFDQKCKDYEDMVDKSSNEAEMLGNELNQLKEFRKKKIQMQKELEEIKEAMVLNEKEHKEQTNRIEEKFFEEKMRLQIEANKKIEELAQKAHDAAIKNLDEVTRNIYKENVQLTEAFKLNTNEIEKLKKQNRQLSTENQKFRDERESNNSLVMDQVNQVSRQARTIKQLRNKTELLEKSLSKVIKEFEIERLNLIDKCKQEIDSSSVEFDKCKKLLALRSKEMNRVKKLAKNIVNQRSDVERFFIDALDYVKGQVVSNRAEYTKNANAMYNSRMLAAHKGDIEFPKVRTFSKKFDAYSTNSVFKDLEQAEKWYGMNDVIDLADLTWEQKEQVLRELFARINGNKATVNSNNSKGAKAGKQMALTRGKQMALTEASSSTNRDTDDDDDDEDSNDVSDFETDTPPINFINGKSANSIKSFSKTDGMTFLTQASQNAIESGENSTRSPIAGAGIHSGKLPSLASLQSLHS